MSKIHYLSLSAILFSTAAWPMKFSAPLRKLNLPVILSTEQPPAIKYTPPGEIAVSALRMCGDGDVAHFESQHADFEFMPHENHDLDVVIGYWVVKDSSGAPDLLPSSANWVPVAYQKIPIAEKAADLQHKGRFLPFSYSPISATTNAMSIIQSELIHLQGLAKNSFHATESYRVFAGVFACNGPDESSAMIPENDSNYDYNATPVQNLHSLSAISSAVDNLFSSPVPALIGKDKLKIDLKNNVADRKIGSDTLAPAPYDYSFGNSGEELGSLASTGKDILEIVYPVLALDNDAYKSHMQGLGIHSKFSGLSGDKIAYCNSVGADSNKTAKTYSNLESFPLNLTCKNLWGSDLQNAYKALFNPDSKPDVVAFANAQKTLAKRFYTAAAYQAAQRKFNNASIPRTGCFRKSADQKLISRIMGSYPLRLVIKNDKYVIENNQHNHLHPESLFALQDYSRYFADDVLAIWGQVEPTQGSPDPTGIKNKGMLLPLNDMSNSKDMGTGSSPVNINFRIRSVGGSCTIYC